MKSQCVNPSFITVKKIAKALDISLDELVDDLGKTPELYELYWAIPRVIKDNPADDMQVDAHHCLWTGCADCTSFPHRIDVCREEVHERLRKLEGTQEENE